MEARQHYGDDGLIMARRVVRSRQGETLLGAHFWKPRQGNTVVLNHTVPMAPAIFPEGYEMKLNDVKWRRTLIGRHVLDGDAFAVGQGPDGTGGYLL